MKTLLTEKLSCCAVVVTALFGLGMGAALADEGNKDGYLIDQRGNLVRNSYNECWRTGYWTPAMAIAECDPNLARKKEPKPAPPAPAYAPEVKSAPAAAVAPPPPARQKMTFSADALFDFDKSDLRPEGKKALDDFVRELRGASYDSITVTGHASRTGPAPYNMKLSVRRAESVKAYLVHSGGIDSRFIKTEGKGETEPVTKPGQCKGTKVTKKLIACLQPDRRVEVDVSGLK